MSKVKKILSWYGSESPGVLSNMARMMNHGYLGGTGKMLILPVDQGFEHGPAQSFAINSEAHNPYYHYELAIESGCNAYAAPLGFLEAGARDFAGEIPLILKVNNSDSLYIDKEAPISACTSSVRDALRLGCSAIGFTIYPASQQRKSMYEEIAEMSREAKSVGLPVIIWAYARGAQLSKKGETAIDTVSYAAHIAAQLGANIIKVKPCTNHIESEKAKKVYQDQSIEISTLADRTKQIIKSAFDGRRIVIFSGGESKTESELLNEIKELATGGSFGSIIGRNSFQRSKKDALQLLRKVMDIYRSV